MRKVFKNLVLAAALAVPSISFAEEAAPNTGALSIGGGVDFVTAYIFRGGVNESDGLIAQPYATLSVKAHESDSLSVTPFVGIWNSIHSETDANPAHGGSDSNWYESDVFAGIDFKFGDFTVSPIYTFYTYPGDSFETIEEIALKVAYNDTKLMEKAGLPITLSPYLVYAYETSDGNGSQDQYLELGITPSYAVPDTALTLSLPIVVGLSVDDYFLDDSGDNEFFGYVSAGLAASYSLPVPAKFGAWTLTGGVYYYSFNADSLKAMNDGDDSIVMGKVGLSFLY